MTGRTAGNLITYLSYEPQMKKFVIHVDREVNLPVFPEFALPVGNYLSEIVDYSRELNLDRICINTQIFLDDNFLLLTPCTYITLEFEIYWIAKRYEGYTSNFAESMTYRDMTQYYKIMAYNYACTLAKQEPRKIKFNINNIALVLSNMYYYEYIKCGYIGHNYVIQILTLFARMKALQEIMNNKTKYNQLLSLTQYCDVQFFEWINSVTSLADLQDKLNNKFRSITGSMSSNDFMRASLYILHDNSIVTINNHPHKPTADIQTHQLPMSENIRLNTELYTLINNIGIQ
jgi:hypothetical protein